MSKLTKDIIEGYMLNNREVLLFDKLGVSPEDFDRYRGISEEKGYVHITTRDGGDGDFEHIRNLRGYSSMGYGDRL